MTDEHYPTATGLYPLRRLGEIDTKLERRGVRESSRYVWERGRATVMFAEVGGYGGCVPATSNGAERIHAFERPVDVR